MTQEQFLKILCAYSGCLVDYQIGKATFVGWIPRSDNRVQGSIFPMKLAKVQEHARQINYLRSIGVDCDGLIEAGWAFKADV